MLRAKRCQERSINQVITFDFSRQAAVSQERSDHRRNSCSIAMLPSYDALNDRGELQALIRHRLKARDLVDRPRDPSPDCGREFVCTDEVGIDRIEGDRKRIRAEE